ncbi:hypothetical protein VSX64_16820, partial [Aurantimonas sp. C2-6-R+9]|nr:hypothetical protein [Aurantimonas sp. C2-6-R+9]
AATTAISASEQRARGRTILMEVGGPLVGRKRDRADTWSGRKTRLQNSHQPPKEFETLTVHSRMTMHERN